MKDIYMLIEPILINEDIYNPIWRYKVKNIGTLETIEIDENYLNKLIEQNRVVNCRSTI